MQNGVPLGKKNPISITTMSSISLHTVSVFFSGTAHIEPFEGEIRTEFKIGHYVGKTGEDKFEPVFEFQVHQQALNKQPDSHQTPQSTLGTNETC